MAFQSFNRLFLVAMLLCASASALSVQPSRRDMMANTFGVVTAAAMSFAPAAFADEGTVLSDEEMAARLARKRELQKAASNGQQLMKAASDIRSDVNPEAGTNLRSRSFVDNAKIAMEKQEEMKSRDKAQKREDLCEMLGRGC